MEMYLKSLLLRNYCGYRDTKFNFTRPDGKPYQFVCFYGPNGFGKSSVLEAISLLTMSTEGRDKSRVAQSLRRYVYSNDYDPSYERISGFEYSNDDMAVSYTDPSVDMLVEGVYVYRGEEYKIALGKNGHIVNDLVPIPDDSMDPDEKKAIRCSGPWGDHYIRYLQRICHRVMADHDLQMNKFQLHVSQRQAFEAIISEVTRFPTKCADPHGMNKLEREYCQDVMIYKDVRGRKPIVHFKRMSAGEKKICKSFSQTMNLMHSLLAPQDNLPPMENWPPILLYDNVEFHVYYNRHVRMIECLKRTFNNQQIFSTTHSGTIIERALRKENDQETELMIDLEQV